MSTTMAENYIRIGMLAVIRDIQEYVDGHSAVLSDGLNVEQLRAYLLGQLIVAGAYDDGYEALDLVTRGES